MANILTTITLTTVIKANRLTNSNKDSVFNANVCVAIYTQKTGKVGEGKVSALKDG